MRQTRSKNVGITLFILLLLTPIYWLLNMSFKTNQEILGGLTLWPQNFTLDNYAVIFTDPSWYNGYIHKRNHHVARGVAGGVCVQPLQIPWRQAPVFLALE